MGASVSCLCTLSTTVDEVPVIKEDGQFLWFKEGTTVKAVLAANPRHKVVLCCQQRTVLSDSFHLICNQLYFLLPEVFELNDENFVRLIRLVQAKQRNSENLGQKLDAERDQKGGKNLHAKGWNSRWKPELETIPEANSPAVPFFR